VISAPHQGRSKALQAAHALATGDYVGWVDSDDLLAPTALAETAAILDAQPGVGMVYTDYWVIDEQGKNHGLGNRCQIPYSFDTLLLTLITFHFRLIRRTVFEQAEGIDMSFACTIDYDLCLRLSEITQTHQLKQPPYFYRTHAQSISRQQQLEQIHCAKRAIDRALKRRGLGDRYELELTIVNTQNQHQGQFRLRRKSPAFRTGLRRLAVSVLGALHLTTTLGTQMSWAQPIVPANDGTGTVVNSNSNQFNISGGTVSGRNLFHSFEKFGLDSGQVATFFSQPNIRTYPTKISLLTQI
jgi:glycosyltransferase involved in cell wall biosynthesis